jgi:predicted molibdopterin-dependent oxidoreductase YjgC
MSYDSAKDVMKEISSLVPIYQGIDQDRLKMGGICWPCPDKGSGEEIRLYGLGSNGDKARLQTSEFQIPVANEDYPFLLLRGSTLYHFLDGTRSIRSTRLQAISASGYMEINPLDANDLGLQDGDSASILNSLGDCSMSLKLSESVPRGIVFCPSFDQSSAALVPLSLDPASPNTSRVRIEKEK